MPWTPPLRILFLLIACSLVLFPLAWASPFDPHLPSFSPSWAEGWYLRITTDPEDSDRGAPRSLGLIFGSVPHGLKSWTNSLALLLIQRKDEERPLKVKEELNPEIDLTYRGHGIEGDPDFDTSPDFEVVAEGVLKAGFDGDTCSIRAKFKHAHLEIKCIGPSEPYGPDKESPEGWLARLKLPLHWYVHSLATPVEICLRRRGRTVTARGWMHAEKNYGESFPPGWIWTQGTSPSKEKKTPNPGSNTTTNLNDDSSTAPTSFVLAGGMPPSPFVPPGLGPQVWLAGVHVGHLQWRFHPWDPTRYFVEAKPCGEQGDPRPTATFQFTAVQPWIGRELRLFIKAPVSSFSEVKCPTRRGFVAFSDHSYSGTAKLELYSVGRGCNDEELLKRVWCLARNGGSGTERRLIHEEVMENVALEFGGYRRECGCRSGNGGVHGGVPVEK